MFEYFFLIIWHVGKPKEPKKGTLKILPQNLNPPPGGPLCITISIFDMSNLQASLKLHWGLAPTSCTNKATEDKIMFLSKKEKMNKARAETCTFDF